MAFDDPIDRMFTETDREQARVNLLQQRSPADVARGRRLARITGIPAPVAEAEPAVAEVQARGQQADSVLNYDPELARWMSAPDNAALARDDLPVLSGVSALLRPWTTAQRNRFSRAVGADSTTEAPVDVGNALDMRAPRTNMTIQPSQVPFADRAPGVQRDPPIDWSLARGLRGAGSMLGEAGLGFAQGTLGLARMYSEWTSPLAPAQQQQAQGWSETLNNWQRAIHPDFAFSWQEPVYQGLVSGTQTLALLGAGAPVVAGLSGVTGGSAYNKYRDRGGSIAAASTGALLEGAIENITERIPVGFLLGHFGGEGVKHWLAGFALSELGGEEAATFLQDAVDTAIANPNKTWAEFWAERPQAALDTALSVLSTAGALGGGLAISQRLQPQARAVEDVARGLNGQAFLDDLMKQAQQSEVRRLDPESFSQFVHDRTDGSPVQNVYIPAESVRAYLQSEGADSEFFTPYIEQIDEALRLNGDLVVPVGEVAAHMDPKVWQALRDDVRVMPGGMSGREARERGRTLMQELETRGAEIAREGVAAGESASPAAEVYGQVRTELLAAGRGEREADAIAQVVAARREAAGERLGISAMAYHQANPITFREAAPGEKAGEHALPQAVEIVPQDESPAATQQVRQAVSDLGYTLRENKAGLSVRGLDSEGVHAVRTLAEDMPVRVLQQSERKGKATGTVRGQAQFGEEPGAIVTLFREANLSTLIHELGHVFLEEMFRDASAKSAPTALKEDVAKICNWFAANGHAVEKGHIPDEAHELFARGFTRYAMEGKAPSAELRGAFAQFRAWLLRIYQVVQNLHAPITPEIREVMARMLATEQAIDGNQETALPLFKSAEEAKMTDEEFAAYTASITGARDEAYDALLYRTMEAICRRETARIKEQMASVRAEVEADINARPEFVALHLLRTGRWLGDPERTAQNVKLNSGWLIDNYGEDALNRMPKGLPILRGDGLDGDVIAEMVGMASGDQLVKTLIAMRDATDRLRASGDNRSPKEALIAQEVERVMAARHGDVLTDGSIEEEAIAAINSARQGEIIAGEMRQLTKRKASLGGPTPYRIAREWARRTIRASRVIDVASRPAVQRYIRATVRTAKAAEEAILKGDVDEAFRQKQSQLLNHALLAEAKIAADEVETIVARMQRYAKRKAMKSVDQDYFDRVHELLERFDFRQRSQREVEEKESFEDWAARKQAQGFEIVVPPRLANRGEHYTRVDVDTLDELNDAVQSLIALGRTKQRLLDDKAERDFNEVRDEIAAHIERLPNRKLPATVTEDEKRAGAAAAAALLKIETIADELDNHDPNGPMNRLLVQRASQAAIERDLLSEKALVPIARQFLSMDRKRQKAMHDKITSDRLTWNVLREGDPQLGSPVTMSRMEWIGVALNTGNLSNLEKMSKGERWPVRTIQDEVNKHLTKEDWDFVQSAWDNVNALWPDIAKVERELSGVVPEEVEGLEVETPHGTYKGRYWPVVYDIARSQRAENNTDTAADDLFGYKAGIATPKGHTITRTNATGPLTYRVEEILVDHIEKVTTRIAYAPWARDVVRMIDNPKVRGLIDTKLGPEYRRQIKPWLRRQITGSTIDKRGSAWWDRAARQIRVNLSISAMGFAYSTGAAQVLGLGYSAGRIGARYVGVGIRKMLHPTEGFAKAQDFVFSRSPEMARRGQELNREVVEVFRTLKGKHGWWTNAQAMAFWHIAMVDRYLVSMPTWLGAHQKAMDEGMTDAEATAYADKIVRNSQGAGREKDLSAIQSPNSEWAKFFTMFYTPFNVLFNAQWDTVRAAKSGDWRRAMMTTTWFMVATVLADALQSGDWPEDEEGNVGFDDLLSWFGRNVFFGLFAGLPLARDGGNYVERKLRGQYADFQDPWSALVEGAYKGGQQTYKIAFEGDEVTSAYIRSMSRTTGAAFGLPGAQFGKTGGFLWDVGTGVAQPDGVADWYRGLTSGQLPEEDRHP